MARIWRKRALASTANRLLLAGLVSVVAALALAPRSEARVVENDSADRMIFWADCDDVVSLSDADLDAWRAKGVGGFVCQTQWLRGLGGTQDFTDNPGADLSGANYELQREIRDTDIVTRAAARDMKLYLGIYFVNYHNPATPLGEWFDDAAWSQSVIPRLRDLAGAAEELGFAGISVDQELYPQVTGERSATWAWDYPGNTHSEAEVREKVTERGRQVMQALLDGFPSIDILLYDFPVPDSWNAQTAEKVNGIRNAYDSLVHLDFWDGMTSVDGYGAIRYINDIFYKTTHLGASWDTAFTYDSNQLFATLSRRFSNWDYASKHFYWSPFAWINAGPDSGDYDDPAPPDYVGDQLSEMRKWGMGGEIANYVYGGLDASQYTDYATALAAAAQPGTVDGVAPTIELGPADHDPRAKLEGIAHDNFAIRSVSWQDNRGGSGVAQLQWKVLSGDIDSGYDWETQWSIPRAQITPGADRVEITAEDIKGNSSRVLSLEPASVALPDPRLTRKPPRRLISHGSRARVRFEFAQDAPVVDAFCQIRNDSHWRRCSGRTFTARLRAGDHWKTFVFEVRADNGAGEPGRRLIRYPFKVRRR